jgi:hypothetical protein
MLGINEVRTLNSSRLFSPVIVLKSAREEEGYGMFSSLDPQYSEENFYCRNISLKIDIHLTLVGIL